MGFLGFCVNSLYSLHTKKKVETLISTKEQKSIAKVETFISTKEQNEVEFLVKIIKAKSVTTVIRERLNTMNKLFHLE